MKCQELEKQKTEAQGKLDELDKEVRELPSSDENSFANRNLVFATKTSLRRRTLQLVKGFAQELYHKEPNHKKRIC